MNEFISPALQLSGKNNYEVLLSEFSWKQSKQWNTIEWGKTSENIFRHNKVFWIFTAILWTVRSDTRSLGQLLLSNIEIKGIFHPAEHSS